MIVTATTFKQSVEAPTAGIWAATVIAWLPLLARTYRPLEALVATVLIESLHLGLLTNLDAHALDFEPMGAFQPVPLATMAAAYTLASRASRPVGWTAGITAEATLFVVGVLCHGQHFLGTDLTMFNLVVLSTGCGVMVTSQHERTERDERERADERRQAALDERLRIARELHDVLAHNLTLVNAQAAVADYLLSRDPAAAAALRDITRHTSRAIDELRTTVGLLRDPEHDDSLRSVVGLSALDDLVSSYRSSGANVTVATTGAQRVLDEHADLAAYRIIQEALTNATKHAPDAPVHVTLEWRAEGLRIGVGNAPSPRPDRAARAPGTGNGVISMEERANAVGGSLKAQPRPGGGFDVTAILPQAKPEVPLVGPDGSP
jgi:signal transduction histidine kinase